MTDEKEIILSTTHDIPGRRIAGIVGIVSGEAVVGVGGLKGMGRAVRDVVGARSNLHEDQVRTAREAAISRMCSEARKQGADGAVGVSFSYQSLSGGELLLVAVVGTAVILGEETEG
ncbi:MAG: heavy metal-binding domain-containing protein [Deltaproteobacteria bacterium]|nr:heavy metal-binding domain-containing protein [Candidatus Zymogenaceae bacterium]